MRLMFYNLLAVPILISVSLPAFSSDRLPVKDGIYLSSGQKCREFLRGELDFVDYEISQHGRAYGVPEVGCVVARVKKIRAGRFAVNADCQEAGDLFQSSFFLEVLRPGAFRIDGEEFLICSADKTNAGKETIKSALPRRNAIDTRSLVASWEEENRLCRGGSGEDPETLKACGRREDIGKLLADKGMCYGKDGQSHFEYVWHRCKSHSIR